MLTDNEKELLRIKYKNLRKEYMDNIDSEKVILISHCINSFCLIIKT